ncbi:MAG: DUF2341 domain-containing protein, partial [Nannocystaceae bacterium]|nr:DUF2341 domain-containing protein [Nannocystaceae bacterium]
GEGTGSTGDVAAEESGTTSVVPTECVPVGWWDVAWGHRRQLLIDNEDIGETLSSFPVLVRLNANRVDYVQTQDDGADLRFVAADGFTRLDHEIEEWNEQGDSFVWVRIPEIPEQGTMPPPIMMYFGNDGAADASAPAGVWSNAYISVHHMGTMTDSTGTGHDGLPAGGPVPGLGVIGPATVFDGQDDSVLLPLEGDYDFGNSMTLEVFFRVESFTSDWQAIVTKGSDAWRLQRNESDDDLAYHTNDGLGAWGLDGDVSVNDGAWHGAAISLNSDDKRIFVDGLMRDETLFLFNISENNSPVMIGGNADEPARFFHGEIDEVRLSETGRSQAWLEASYRAMLDQGIVLYGEPEACAG